MWGGLQGHLGGVHVADQFGISDGFRKSLERGGVDEKKETKKVKKKGKKSCSLENSKIGWRVGEVDGWRWMEMDGTGLSKCVPWPTLGCVCLCVEKRCMWSLIRLDVAREREQRERERAERRALDSGTGFQRDRETERGIETHTERKRQRERHTHTHIERERETESKEMIQPWP